MTAAPRVTGTVKWFSDVKGYGFITQDDRTAPDVFVHFKQIRRASQAEHRKLLEGDRVKFTITPGRDDRDQASDVEKLPKEDV